MNILLKKFITPNLIRVRYNLITLVQHGISNKNQIPASKKSATKTKEIGISSVKTPSPKKGKKSSKKLALEEIIEQEANEIPGSLTKPVPKKSSKGKKGKKSTEPIQSENIVVEKSPKKTAKGKKGKKSKEPIQSESLEEVEKVNSNKVHKKTHKKEESKDLKDDISTLNVNIDSIKLGNQYSGLPIQYELKCDKSAENPYENYIQTRTSLLTKSYILNERVSSCYNYAPLPVVLRSGNGIFVQDVDNHTYVDFLSGYSSLNFGHCNKEILNPVIPYLSVLHMTSRAFHNTILGNVSKILASLFDMDKVLFMNSGVEAGESAIKFARRWGYMVKNIPDNQAEVVFFLGNFWGRTISACGSSDDKYRYYKFGPFGGLGFHLVPYNDITKLEEILKERPNICGVMLEPIQGENGVIIPQEDYLIKVRELCNKYKALMIVDEIQTAFGRGAGNTSVCRSKNVKPDLLLLGKSLSGGFYPVSAVVGKNEVMDLIRPGEHGSTYGGNPLALRFVYSTLNYLTNGKYIMDVNNKEGMMSIYLKFNSKFIKEIRGRGMLFAIEVFEDSPVSAHEVCLYLMERGILCKPTKSNILRLSPPIIINENELYRCCSIIKDVFRQLENLYPNYDSNKQTNFNFPIITPEAAKIVTDRINRENINSQEEVQIENLHIHSIPSQNSNHPHNMNNQAQPTINQHTQNIPNQGIQQPHNMNNQAQPTINQHTQNISNQGIQQPHNMNNQAQPTINQQQNPNKNTEKNTTIQPENAKKNYEAKSNHQTSQINNNKPSAQSSSSQNTEKTQNSHYSIFDEVNKGSTMLANSAADLESLIDSICSDRVNVKDKQMESEHNEKTNEYTQPDFDFFKDTEHEQPNFKEDDKGKKNKV